MNTMTPLQQADSNGVDLSSAYENVRAAFAAEPYAEMAVRRDRLKRLEAALLDYADALVDAMSEDFSYRSPVESRLFDITASLGEIRFARRNLKRWMKTRRVRTPLHLLPARGRILPQPLGVVGIISPWNFPVFLALPPLATALAAGNRVMLKPSELSPRTSAVLAEMLSNTFSPEEVAVVTGGPDVAQAFSSLPFDHLLFTGSTAVGRKVALAAAQNLTPVTLELGGKSPAIITPSADLDRAAKRIAWGKAASAGQLCVSPDYVLVPRSQIDALAQKILSAWQAQYPQGSDSVDYSAIVTDRHLQRLNDMVTEAQSHGAEVIQLPKGSDPLRRKIPPTIVVDPSTDITVMQEEVFGPILSLIPYDTQQDALDFVAGRDRPLALYIFAERSDDKELWLIGSHSGGVCVNDVVIHVGCDTLPFGGVGASGSGAYHGDRGFETFSHMKSVLSQTKLNGTFLAVPPYGPVKRKVWELIERFI